MKTKIPPGTPTVPLMVAAARLGLQYHTVRSLVLKGTLVGDRTPGGWIVTEDSITQYESAQRAAPEPPHA